jgi:kynurenine formamidase
MSVKRWNQFGDSTPRGALNFVDAQKVLEALSIVRTGEIISLNLPLDAPTLRGRPALKRTVQMHNHLRDLGSDRYAVVNDDAVEIALQGSSHWDSFAHFGVLEPGVPGIFFGGAGIEETTPEPKAKTLGIDAFAPGIVTRGVVLDVVAAVDPHDPYLSDETVVTRAVIEACLARQKVDLRRGDIALLYTGFEHRRADGRIGDRIPGIDGSTVPLFVEAEIAAIAADNVAVEHLPGDLAVHQGALRDAGILLGEYWALDALVQRCRADGAYDCLVASVPLNLPGSFGSPANAIAVR